MCLVIRLAIAKLFTVHQTPFNNLNGMMSTKFSACRGPPAVSITSQPTASPMPRIKNQTQAPKPNWHPSTRFIMHFGAMPLKSASALSCSNLIQPYQRTPLVLIKRMAPFLLPKMLTPVVGLILGSSIQTCRGIVYPASLRIITIHGVVDCIVDLHICPQAGVEV